VELRTLQHKQESFVIQYQESLKISSESLVLSRQSVVGCSIPVSVIGGCSSDFASWAVMFYSKAVLLGRITVARCGLLLQTEHCGL